MTIELRSKQGALILSVAILVSGLGFLMSSAVTLALPTIQKNLGIGIANIQWIMNAYVLTLGSLILISGALGDIFGQKRVFAWGIFVFTAASILCAISWNTLSLAFFRAIQGIGAACMIPGSLAVLNRMFKKEQRGRVIGLWAGVSGGIAALGPLIGGFLADLSWRLVFAAMIPVGVLSLVMVIALLPRLPGSADTHIDWQGALLIMAGLGALSFAFISISERGFGWRMLAWSIGGLLATGLFIFRETRAPNPLVPPEMFNRNMTVANIATFFLYFSFQGALFLLSYRLQQLHGYSGRNAGLALVPAIALIALFTGPSGALTDRIGPRAQLSIGPVAVALASLWWLIRREGNNLTAILPGVLLLGAGMVLVIPSITKTALDVQQHHSGAASGLNNGASRIAGLFAVALAGSILALAYTASLERTLREQGFGTDVIRKEIRQSDQLLAAPLPEAQRQVMIVQLRRRAFVRGFRAAVAILGGAALLAGGVSYAGLRKEDRARPSDQFPDTATLL